MASGFCFYIESVCSATAEFSGWIDGMFIHFLVKIYFGLADVTRCLAQLGGKFSTRGPTCSEKLAESHQ